MNYRAKFDDNASFILAGEIRNRTNKLFVNSLKKQKNSNRYIHTLPITCILSHTLTFSTVSVTTV